MVDHPMMRRYGWLLALAAVMLLAACSSGQDINLAEAGVAHFREQMTAQQFDQIYSEAADDLKKTTTQEAMTRLLGAVEHKLGAVKSASRNAWSVNFNASGTSVTLKYKTAFEHGSGEETFAFRISGGKALLAGYHINSNELITN
jgi:hypothetical protein